MSKLVSLAGQAAGEFDVAHETRGWLRVRDGTDVARVASKTGDKRDGREREKVKEYSGG